MKRNLVTVVDDDPLYGERRKEETVVVWSYSIVNVKSSTIVVVSPGRVNLRNGNLTVVPSPPRLSTISSPPREVQLDRVIGCIG